MITLDTLRREKRTGIVNLGEKYGARNIRVFGSVARGDSHSGSDVDFLEDKNSPQLRTALAESATLRVKGLKEMKPRDIQIETDGKVLTVFFAFPRDQAILVEHKEAEFAAHIGPLKVKSSFKLAKMIRSGKLDL